MFDVTTRDLLVLLDSGAHVDVICRGLLHPSLLCTTSQPVRLKVANGTCIFGGSEQANLSLHFWPSHSPQVDFSTTSAEFSDLFYQANILGYNLPVAYPFMVNSSMGALPHCRCLVIESEDVFLYLIPRSQLDLPAIKTIPPCMPQDVLPDRPTRWVTSSYTIYLQHLQTWLQHVGYPTPTVDALPSAGNHQFSRYWTKMDGAWQQKWSNPWSEWLEQVVQKFISDKAQQMLLLRDYSSACPFNEAAHRGALNSITLADCTVPPHTKLFLSGNGKASGRTPCNGGTWAIWVDGFLDALPSEVDTARISAVRFQYEEDTDLMMPIWSP